MRVSILDLSRNARPLDASLNVAFKDAVVEVVDKAVWKGLGAKALLREVRAVSSDLFVIGVDDVSSIQDETLTKALGVFSRARRFALLEMPTGRIFFVSRARFLFGSLPWLALQILGASLFIAAFAVLVALLGGVAWVRRGSVSSAYGKGPSFKRVAYLKSDLALNITAGGSIAHTRGVIGGFASNGADVRIFSNENVPWLAIADVPLVVLDRTRLFSVVRETERMVNGIWFGLQAISALKEFQPDVVYQRKSLLDLSGVIVSLWYSIPLVIEGNDSVVMGTYWERARLRRISGWVERVQFAASSVAVSVSEPLLETFGKIGYDTRRIKVIFNGVDVQDFATTQAASDALKIRSELGIASTEKVVGFVGTFGQWHGIPVLTEAMIRTLKDRQDVRFLLVGDGELRRQCEVAVAAHVSSGRVIFTGLIPGSRVAAYLEACDVLVSPHSRSPDGRKFFGSPTKLFEYMAAGKAIVASDLDQIGEIVEDRMSGLLFEPDDVDGFCSALNSVLEEASLRQRLGEGARTRVAMKYTWHANVAIVLDELRRCSHVD